MGVESIDEFLPEQRLRWLGHVERKDKEREPVKALHFKLNDAKKGMPKKRWKKVVKRDVIARGLQRMNTQDCTRSRLCCKNRLTCLAGEPTELQKEEDDKFSL